MPKLRVHGFAISLDGYGAGPRQDLDNPLGVGGVALHRWLVSTRTFRKTHGEDGGTTGVDDDFAARGFDNIGAWILGRNMFGPVRARLSISSRRESTRHCRPVTPLMVRMFGSAVEWRRSGNTSKRGSLMSCTSRSAQFSWVPVSISSPTSTRRRWVTGARNTWRRSTRRTSCSEGPCSTGWRFRSRREACPRSGLSISNRRVLRDEGADRRLLVVAGQNRWMRRSSG
jgi:hypothetical protein